MTPMSDATSFAEIEAIIAALPAFDAAAAGRRAAAAGLRRHGPSGRQPLLLVGLKVFLLDGGKVDEERVKVDAAPEVFLVLGAGGRGAAGEDAASPHSL